MENKPVIQIHALLPVTYANGPGCRFGLWVQGCSIHCPGCFNPKAQPRCGGVPMTAPRLLSTVLSVNPSAEGITISGGEPFQQAAALAPFLHLIRTRTKYSILLFSGYEWEDLTQSADCRGCLAEADALICGPYRKDLPPAPDRFCASSNQRLILLSSRYQAEDFANLSLYEAIVDKDGTIRETGIKSPRSDNAA